MRSTSAIGRHLEVLFSLVFGLSFWALVFTLLFMLGSAIFRIGAVQARAFAGVAPPALAAASPAPRPTRVLESTIAGELRQRAETKQPVGPRIGLAFRVKPDAGSSY